MKIAILTQSMAANYGCNLQAYALQTVLEQFGHEVEILDRWFPIKRVSPFLKSLRNIKIFFKDCVKFCLRRPIYHAFEDDDKPYFWRNFIEFQRQYLHLSSKLYSTEDLKIYAKLHNYDAYIVGSDQVWRPAYNLGDKLYDMYLSFISGQEVIRISYAASFGVDYWEYSDEQTIVCSELLKQFDAISVREDSGVHLCKNYLNVQAKHVLDPTMLLDASDYNKIIGHENTKKVKGDLFCYILDCSIQMLEAMDLVEQRTSLKSFTCLPLVPQNTYEVFHRESGVLPSPQEWLCGFRDSKMVLVDSFHGVVFSIIYNKPFWVIGNQKRGMARFNSLLSLFGLEERLVSLDQLKCVDLNKQINWDDVNSRRATMVIDSKMFLKDALTKL